MIDLRDLRENPERYRDSQRARGADVGLVDRIIEADESRRSRLQDFESLRAEQKSVSASVGRASQQDRPAVLARARELAVHVKEAEAAASAAASILDDLAHQIANLIEGAPAGGEEDYVVVRHEGPEPRDFAAEGAENDDPHPADPVRQAPPEQEPSRGMPLQRLPSTSNSQSMSLRRI